MKQAISSVVALCALQSLLLTPALAQSDQPVPLAAEAEVGLLATSGNTDSTALKAKLKLKQDLTRWRNHYVLEALYKQDELLIVEDGEARTLKQVTAERYFGSAQADYKLDEQYRGLFVFGSYEEDKFSGYDFQAALAAGYSNRLFETPRSYLDYSIGPGVSFTGTGEILDVDGNVLQDNVYERSAMVRVSARYQFDFSDNAKFTQTFASDVAIEADANSKSKAESAVTAALNDSFAMKASFTITHNTQVPDNRVSTDRQSAVTLVYTF